MICGGDWLKATARAKPAQLLVFFDRDLRESYFSATLIEV
jgi:hypothetical protein